jgi:NADPH:quinone reductase-like Zn-dependent oxidoreductase
VRLHASSLNFHDYGVVSTPNRVSDGRIPMSDGAGLVEAVGEDVTEFEVGDHVVSCFSRPDGRSEDGLVYLRNGSVGEKGGYFNPNNRGKRLIVRGERKHLFDSAKVVVGTRD